MAKIKIDSALFARAKNVVEVAGYSSLEEFVTHIIEKEVAKYEQTNTGGFFWLQSQCCPGGCPIRSYRR